MYNNFRIVEVQSPLNFTGMNLWNNTFTDLYTPSSFKPLSNKDRILKNTNLVKRSVNAIQLRLEDDSYRTAGSAGLYSSKDQIVRYFYHWLIPDKGVDRRTKAFKKGDYAAKFLGLTLKGITNPEFNRQHVNESIDDGYSIFIAPNGLLFMGWNYKGMYKMAVVEKTILTNEPPEDVKLGMNIEEFCSSELMERYRIDIEIESSKRGLHLELSMKDIKDPDQSFYEGAFIRAYIGRRMKIDGLKVTWLYHNKPLNTESFLRHITEKESYRDFWSYFGIDANNVNLVSIISETTPFNKLYFESEFTANSRQFTISGIGTGKGFQGKGCKGQMISLVIKAK